MPKQDFSNDAGKVEKRAFELGLELNPGQKKVDMKLDVPGNYVLVDHALTRLDRGAWMLLKVNGNENLEIFSGETANHEHSKYE